MARNVSRPVSTISRLLWIVPVLLVLLAINQIKVGIDLRQTYLGGEHAIATVTDYERVDRADITYGYVSLVVPLADGTTIRRDEMPLPYSLLHRIEGRDSLEVVVQPGAAQEIVVEMVANAQWKMALIQSAIAFVAAIMAFVAVFAWRRLLESRGDPARIGVGADAG